LRQVDPATLRCEHLFVTSLGSAYARFRRPSTPGTRPWRWPWQTELDFVSLPDALELVLLLVGDPTRFRRAAPRWHARYCGELPDLEAIS
jgi:hypothetical protein